MMRFLKTQFEILKTCVVLQGLGWCSYAYQMTPQIDAEKQKQTNILLNLLKDEERLKNQKLEKY